MNASSVLRSLITISAINCGPDTQPPSQYWHLSRRPLWAGERTHFSAVSCLYCSPMHWFFNSFLFSTLIRGPSPLQEGFSPTGEANAREKTACFVFVFVKCRNNGQNVNSFIICESLFCIHGLIRPQIVTLTEYAVSPGKCLSSVSICFLFNEMPCLCTEALVECTKLDDYYLLKMILIISLTFHVFFFFEVRELEWCS